MSSRNDYWAYLSLQNDGLAHHGVKGMKWGVRKDEFYESRRTNRLRTGIENYDADIKRGTGNPRVDKKLTRSRNRLYNRYNRSKNRDFKRKQYAVKHPSHIRNFLAMEAKGALVGAGILAVGGAIGVHAISKGNLDIGTEIKIARGMRVAAAVSSAQLLYTHIERGRAIEAVYNGKAKNFSRR